MAAARDTPPAVARWRVRRALRQARLEAGLVQSDVAHRLNWSLSKLQRVEIGDVGISITDLRALLGVYGVDDEAKVDQLTRDATVSRRQRWSVPAAHREHLTPGLRELMQFETEATAIRAYQAFLLPGVMQTPAMADFLLSRFDKSLSVTDRKVRFDVRMMRAKRILEDDHAPVYLLMLDEALLDRTLGGRAIMADQLEALVAAAQRPNIRIRIVARAEGAMIGMLGAFTVLNLGDEPDSAVLYREQETTDRIVQEPEIVTHYRVRFEESWSQCYDEAGSLELIRSAAASLRAEMIRAPLPTIDA